MYMYMCVGYIIHILRTDRNAPPHSAALPILRRRPVRIGAGGSVGDALGDAVHVRLGGGTVISIIITIIIIIHTNTTITITIISIISIIIIIVSLL